MQHITKTKRECNFNRCRMPVTSTLNINSLVTNTKKKGVPSSVMMQENKNKKYGKGLATSKRRAQGERLSQAERIWKPVVVSLCGDRLKASDDRRQIPIQYDIAQEAEC